MLGTWKLQVMNRSGIIAAAAAATIIVLAVGGRGSCNRAEDPFLDMSDGDV